MKVNGWKLIEDLACGVALGEPIYTAALGAWSSEQLALLPGSVARLRDPLITLIRVRETWDARVLCIATRTLEYGDPRRSEDLVVRHFSDAARELAQSASSLVNGIGPKKVLSGTPALCRVHVDASGELIYDAGWGVEALISNLYDGDRNAGAELRTELQSSNLYPTPTMAAGGLGVRHSQTKT